MVKLNTSNSKTADLEGKSIRRLLSLQEEINELFTQMLTNRFGRKQKDITCKHAYIPPIDIYDSGKFYKVMVELPGLKPDDIEINIENGFLALKGTRKSGTEDKAENFVFREIIFGSFERSFPLPDNVDIEKKCKSKLIDGILSIKLPKFDKSKRKKGKYSITPRII